MSSPVAILSPHLDDAVLSCWHVLAGAADVTVVNVFAGLPSPDAPRGWWDALADQGDPRATVARRLAEDATALALARRTPINLGFVDRQYRDRDQPQEPLVEALFEALPRDAVVYAPAAIAPAVHEPGPAGSGAGAHPDRGAVRTAALALRSRGFRVSLYADLPHASARGWPHWVRPGAPAASAAPSLGAGSPRWRRSA